MIGRLIEEHPGMLIGISVGLVLGFIFLLVGFWKTIIFLAFVLIGLYIGKRFDSDESFKEILQEFLPDKFFK
ncbi:MAG: DUF2273 domain-containing protein [Vulcanibacillus sp.]